MWTCKKCGFKAPTDWIGKAIMDEHLAAHAREARKKEARRGS